MDRGLVGGHLEEGDGDLGNVGEEDEGEVQREERRLCVWRGREVVRGGVRECASDSCPHSGAGPRTYVSLFLVVLEETFLKSFCRPRPLMIYTVEKFV